MTNMLNVFNPSTFYSSLKRAGWLYFAYSLLTDETEEDNGNVGLTF